jgi:hypothetical protein
MVLDDSLLANARNASAKAAEAERAALLARADYHTAVRRLHLAGGSLREIAEALALSHQRVQQIVDAAGGTWWRRVWRTRGSKRDAVCTFCTRPPSEVKKLVAGPNVYLCDACASQAHKALTHGNRAGFTVTRKRNEARCSFCGKRSGREKAVMAGEEAAVCDACLVLCGEIIAGGPDLDR